MFYNLIKKIKKVNIKREKKEVNKRLKFKKIANKLFKHRFRGEPKKVKTELLPKKKKKKITIPVYSRYIKPSLANPYYNQRLRYSINDLIESWEGHDKLFLILNPTAYETNILNNKKNNIIDIIDYDFWISKFNNFKYTIFNNNILNEEFSKELYKLNKELKIGKINGFLEKIKDDNNDDSFIKNKASYILLKYPLFDYANEDYIIDIKKDILENTKNLKFYESSDLIISKEDNSSFELLKSKEKKLDDPSLLINVLKKFSNIYNDNLNLINTNKLSLIKQPKINSLVFNKPTSNLSLFLTKKNINLLSLFKQYLNKKNKYYIYKIKKKSIFKYLKFNKKSFFISKNINWSMFSNLKSLSKKITKLNNRNINSDLSPKYYVSTYGINIIKIYNSISNFYTTNYFLENSKKTNIRNINYNFLKKKTNSIIKNNLYIKKIIYYNNPLYILLSFYLLKKKLIKYNLNFKWVY